MLLPIFSCFLQISINLIFWMIMFSLLLLYVSDFSVHQLCELSRSSVLLYVCCPALLYLDRQPHGLSSQRRKRSKAGGTWGFVRVARMPAVRHTIWACLALRSTARSLASAMTSVSLQSRNKHWLLVLTYSCKVFARCSLYSCFLSQSSWHRNVVFLYKLGSDR